MAILHLDAPRKRVCIVAVALLAVVIAGLGTNLKTAATAYAAPVTTESRQAVQFTKKTDSALVAQVAKSPLNIQNHYYHSWYITENSTSYMQALAKFDANWASDDCPTKYAQNVTILTLDRWTHKTVTTAYTTSP